MRDMLHLVRRYGPATLFTAIALLLTIILGPFPGRYPYVLLAGAVVASALHGGLRPGVYATILAAVALSFRYVCFPTPESPASFGEFAAQLALAVFVGLLASYLGEHCWRAVRASEWLQTALGSAGEGVVFTDAEGTVTHIDSVAQKIFACGQEVVGETKLDVLLRLLDADTRMLLPGPVDRSFTSRTETRLAEPTLLVTRSGVEQPITGCITPILERDGTVDGAVLVLRVMRSTRSKAEEAKRKELDDSLAQTRQELEQSQSEHSGTRDQLQRTQRDLQTQTARHESTQSEFEQARRQHGEEVRRLSAQLDGAKDVDAERRRLSLEVSKRDAEVTRLTRDLDASRQKYEQQLKQQTGTLQKQLDDAQEREKKLQQQMQQQMQNLRKQIEGEYAQRLARLEAERDRLKVDLDNAVERELHAEEALAQAQNHARTHGDQLVDLQKNEDRLHQELRDVREAAERHRRHGVLSHSLARTIGGAVITVDRRGFTLFVNPAAEALLGWKEADVPGRRIHHRLLSPGTDDVHEEMQQAGRTARDREAFARRDGGMIRVRCDEAPLFVEGQDSGTVISFTEEQQPRPTENRRPRPVTSDAEVAFAGPSEQLRPVGLLHQHDEWLDYN